MSAASAREAVLRRALLANAAFSALSGVILALSTPWLTPELGLASVWALPVLGLGLLGFAAVLVHATRGSPVDRSLARGAVLADGAWVLGSAGVLAWDPTGVTRLGWWLVLGVAGVVLGLALAQAWGLRALDDRPPGPGER